jgi:hypothetical protein
VFSTNQSFLKYEFFFCYSFRFRFVFKLVERLILICKIKPKIKLIQFTNYRFGLVFFFLIRQNRWTLKICLIEFAALGGAVPPQSSGPTFTPQPPPQANQSVPTPQPYGGNYFVPGGKLLLRCGHSDGLLACIQ